MLDYFYRLTGTDFVPHGDRLGWQPAVIWLSVISEALSTLAFFAIAFLLITVVRKRKDLPSRWRFLAFGASLLAFGATHALAFAALWVPVYRLYGWMTALAALASVVMALGLARLRPALVKIPTPGQFESLNRELAEEKSASSFLREREQQFKLACHYGQVATWIWNLKTDEFVVSSSNRGKEDDVAGDHFFSIHPDDKETVRLSFENARNCVSEFGVEFRSLDATGTVHWVAARGAVEQLENGPPVRMTGVSIDITARKEVETALAQSEKQFESLADSIPNLAWVANADGYITWYNKRWYEYTNTTPEQVTGWKWESLHDPDLLPVVKERWLKSISTGEMFEMEFPLRGGDGVFHWFLTRFTPVLGQDGQLLRWFGTNTDVTEIYQAREALRESESHFRQIANSLPQMVWIASLDGAVQWLNQRWYDFTGSTAEQSEGDGWTQFTHPDDSYLRAGNWQYSLAKPTLFESEVRCRRHDGIYRWFLIRGNPVLGAKGEVVKWFGTYTDIEDYKQAQTEILRLNHDLEARVAARTAELSEANGELRRTQTWLRAVLDSATQASIIAIDNNGVIALFNSGAEKLLGYGTGELVGKRGAQVFDPAELVEHPDRRRSSEGRNRAAAAFDPEETPDGAFISESVYVHRDGTRIDVSVAHTPMVDTRGQRLGTLRIALDIRPRKILERQLNQNNIDLREQTRSAQAADRAKSDFLAVMSHELRTPMNAILGMADLLWESELETTQRKYVEVFRRAGTNLLTLVNDILDLSKIESGQFELELIDFDLIEVVERTVDMIRPKTQAKHIGLLVRISPDVPIALRGDPTRLQQILINLLGNAVKFTEKGQITLSITPDPFEQCRLHFDVTDTGIGIHKDKVHTIFRDFTQAESSTTRRYGGTGLGLGICRPLASRMGGELKLTSEPGKGSSFFFDAVFEMGVQERPQRADLPVGTAGRRVLIIDNNATNRLIFSEMCGAWGMIPTEFATAEEAIRALQSAALTGQPFEIAILDRLMPGLDGFQVLSQIRQIDARLPIIMATSDKVPGDETKSKQLGVAGYTVKPVRRSELLRLITDALNAGPLAPETPTERETPAVRAPLDTAARILIAEDSDDNRFLLRAYLKDQPFEVTFAADGALAVEIATLQSFDLILMDVQMPVMDGLTATRRIREMERELRRPQTPILALTANARTEDFAASRDAGCSSHLSKPITKPTLLRAIREHVRNSEVSVEARVYSISVPEGLEQGAKRYIQSRKGEVSHLIQLLQANDYARLKHLAHNMKGTGTSYGFPDLTRLGESMETAALAQDGDGLASQLVELSRYVQEAEDFMAMAASENP